MPTPESATTFDAAVLERGADGTVKVVDKHEASTRHGAWEGLAIGAVAAVLLPGIGLAVGAADWCRASAIAGPSRAPRITTISSSSVPCCQNGQAGLIAIYATNLADQVAASIKAENKFVLQGDRRERRRPGQADQRGRRQVTNC